MENEKKKRYYIFTPAGLVSGGPELAHQMCSELCRKGHPAWMYYIQGGGKEPVDVPADDRYGKYGTDHAVSIQEVESEDAVIIVPEATALWSLVYGKCTKVIWWMSVDNYITHTKEAGWDFFEELKEIIALHLVQSKYAYEYLLERGVPEQKILWVSDYISENYGKFYMPAEFRQNIALYNPKKGLEELKPLIGQADWLKWIPLAGLTEEQMAAIMGVAKVYVDFGAHPGKDRIPREAASGGCCVVTNRKGSAAFQEDIPIPETYKFEEPLPYDQVEELLKDICCNWEGHSRQFDGYREVISSEKRKFSEDVEAFVHLIEQIV